MSRESAMELAKKIADVINAHEPGGSSPEDALDALTACVGDGRRRVRRAERALLHRGVPRARREDFADADDVRRRSTRA